MLFMRAFHSGNISRPDPCYTEIQIIQHIFWLVCTLKEDYAFIAGVDTGRFIFYRLQVKRATQLFITQD